MSKDWPTLGQANISKGKSTTKANSFAAAVKIQVAELEEVEAKSGKDEQLQPPVEQKLENSISWEERKAAIRAAKLAQKEERKIKREENARRKLLAPKGYRLQLIQSNNTAASSKSGSTSSQEATFLDSSLFPELGSTRKIIKTSSPAPPPVEVLPEIIKNPNLPVSKKKKPEKHLTVNLELLLQARPKKVVVSKKKKINVRRVMKEETLSGNPLDSSQPVRHRGKVREIPKKKRKSSLKIAIVAYRKLKELQRAALAEKELAEIKEECLEADISQPDEASNNTTNTPVLIDQGEPLKVAEDLPFTSSDFIHSRKFRDYCDNLLSKELDDSVQSFLKLNVELQDKSYHKDPNKHKKRILSGLHEARKSIIMKKTKIIIIAPDLEKCPQAGGLDTKILELVKLCKENGTPYAFALGRRKLGKILKKKVPVSCAALINIEGTEDLFGVLNALLSPMKEAYTRAIFKIKSDSPSVAIDKNSQTDINKLVVSSLLTALEQSLQAPKTPEFLKVIDSIQAEPDSE